MYDCCETNWNNSKERKNNWRIVYKKHGKNWKKPGSQMLTWSVAYLFRMLLSISSTQRVSIVFRPLFFGYNLSVNPVAFAMRAAEVATLIWLSAGEDKSMTPMIDFFSFFCSVSVMCVLLFLLDMLLVFLFFWCALIGIFLYKANK